jgi:hypothetical protein
LGDEMMRNYSSRWVWAKSSQDPISNKGSTRWCEPVIPASWGSINRRFLVQPGPGIEGDPISKITNTKRAPVVERLPSKCKTLSSTPNTTKTILSGGGLREDIF